MRRPGLGLSTAAAILFLGASAGFANSSQDVSSTRKQLSHLFFYEIAAGLCSLPISDELEDELDDAQHAVRTRAELTKREAVEMFKSLEASVRANREQVCAGEFEARFEGNLRELLAAAS